MVVGEMMGREKGDPQVGTEKRDSMVGTRKVGEVWRGCDVRCIDQVHRHTYI
jgi:hypothetical protein